jgi:hypothetical protein
MKATVTIQFIADDLESVERIIQAGLGTSAKVETVVEVPTCLPPSEPNLAESVQKAVEDGIAKDDAEEAARKRSEASKKAAATKKRNAAAKEAADQAKVNTSVDKNLKKADAPKAAKVSDGDLKKAVKDAIADNGIEHVRKVFSTFDSKDKKPCVKLSDVKPGDFAAVVEALK